MKTLPSRRAIGLAIVGTVAIAAWAPPGAVWWIPLWTIAVWLAARGDGRAAARDGAFHVERTAPERVPQGEWADVSWTVRAGAGGLRGLVIAERLPEDVEREGVEPSFSLPPGGLARAAGRLRPRRRGVFTLGPGAARVLGPRGLGWRRVTLGDAVEIRVDPPVDAMRRLSLDESRARRRGGAPRRLRGIGSEFESLRDYRLDDDSRWIDWKASARRRRLTSREYQVEEHRSVMFLLDAGRLMATEEGNRSKLDHALGATLALGHAAMSRGDRVGVVAFDRTPSVELPPGHGRAHSARLHEALSRVQAHLVEPDWSRAFAALRRVARQRSLVIVFTDLVDDRVSDALLDAVTRASRRDLVMVATLADVALLERVATPPARPRDAYRNAVAADALLLRDAAIGRLRAAGVEVVDAPADRLAGEVVEAYLRVRRENRV